MCHATSQHDPFTAAVNTPPRGFISGSEIAELRKVWIYNPGRHYMRGPGPKWREKHASLCVADMQSEPPVRIDGSDKVVSSLMRLTRQ